MMKTYHIPALAFFLLCTTTALLAQRSVYDLPFENKLKLPPLETYVDLEEIATSYQTQGNLYTTEISGLEDEPIEQSSSMMISDVKASDAFRFLKFYMEEQLVEAGSETRGSVEMSVIYYHSKSRFNVGTVLGVLTFGFGTLLGIPYSTNITDVEVEASFYNLSNHLMATHRGIGRSRKIETLYNSDNKRIAHQRALKRALEDLNSQIMADPKLREKSRTNAHPQP